MAILDYTPLLCYYLTCINHYVAPSSSGPGRQVLILKIAGSTPAGVTKPSHTGFTDVKMLLKTLDFGSIFIFVKFTSVVLFRFP